MVGKAHTYCFLLLGRQSQMRKTRCASCWKPAANHYYYFNTIRSPKNTPTDYLVGFLAILRRKSKRLAWGVEHAQLEPNIPTTIQSTNAMIVLKIKQSVGCTQT